MEWIADRVAYKGNDQFIRAFKGSELIWEKEDYFCFTSLENSSKIAMTHYRTSSREGDPKPVLQYSRDGRNWTNWNYGNITANKDQKVYFRGDNESISFNLLASYSTFTGTGKFNLSGNIMSLLSKTNYKKIEQLPMGCFTKLFYNNWSIIDASKMSFGLPKKLSNYSFGSMFFKCKNLIDAPTINVYSSGVNAMDSMFRDCSMLQHIKV